MEEDTRADSTFKTDERVGFIRMVFFLLAPFLLLVWPFLGPAKL